MKILSNITMEKMIMLAVVVLVLMGAPSVMAAQKPYWSETPVNSPDHKQVHLIITHIDANPAVVRKTEIVLSMHHNDENVGHAVDLVKHIVDISKHVKPTELNATLDVGYFIIPNSLIESKNSSLNVEIHVLGQDGTVVQPLNDTVYMDLDDYFQII